MTMKKTFLVLAVAVALPLAASADPLQASRGDLVAKSLVRSAPATPDGVERAPVSFAWRLADGATLDAATPFVAESREFYTELDADQLAKGYGFEATAPGAMIRVSPLGTGKRALSPADVVLRHNGRVLDDSAKLQAVDAAALKAAGMPVAEGTVAFRIDPTLGAGRFELAVPGASKALLHVYEPDSDVVASMRAARDTFHVGDRFDATLRVTAGDRDVAAQRVRGVLTAPDGRAFDVDVALDPAGRANLDAALPSKASSVPGLWELHGFASAIVDGVEVLRDVKTSFAVAAPTAKLAGDARTMRRAGALTVAVPVEVGVAGRYEVRGHVYADRNGVVEPIAVAHAAAWLEPGAGTITLRVPADVLGADAANALELRDVSLNDQGRLAKLETRAAALRIAAAPRDSDTPRGERQR